MVSTLLDTQQTTVEEQTDDTSGYWKEDWYSKSIAFRHRNWWHKRLAMQEALVAAGVPAARLTRFNQCGGAAYVYRSCEDPKKYKIMCTKCHDRVCSKCANERARMYARDLRSRLVGVDLRFVTLTLKHCDQPLPYQLNHLYRSFRKLRQRVLWKRSVTDFVGFLELKFNSNLKRWHPHLHILCSGDYIDQKQLSESWMSITKSSFVVDIRKVEDTETALTYVTKYAGKGINFSALSDMTAATEAIQSLSGRRTIISSNGWKPVKPDQPQDEEPRWSCVAPLGKLLTLALMKDSAAVAIMESISPNWRIFSQCTNSTISDLPSNYHHPPFAQSVPPLWDG